MEELQNPISRRRMLKRVGAGAAIAWSAPILSSLRTPAFAQAYPTRCQGGPGTGCAVGGDHCGGQVDCGEGCSCLATSAGDCFCHQFVSCGNAGVTACTSDADCGPSQTNPRGEGWRCASSCCGTNLCHPPCGAEGVATARGAGTSGG
jgi:hypothetical protein